MSKKPANATAGEETAAESKFKQFKQRSRSTGEDGIQKIKEGFPYFDIFVEVIGHRDFIDPSKMADPYGRLLK